MLARTSGVSCVSGAVPPAFDNEAEALWPRRITKSISLYFRPAALAELKRHCFFLVIYNRIVFSLLFTMAGRLTVHLACQPTQVPSIDSRLMFSMLVLVPRRLFGLHFSCNLQKSVAPQRLGRGFAIIHCFASESQ
jgi:hypothetical protein